MTEPDKGSFHFGWSEENQAHQIEIPQALVGRSLEQLADWLVSRKDIDALLMLLLNRTNMACICRNCQLKSNED